MKEIGGYFELEELCGKEYYPDLIHLNLGRTALLYILKALNASKLAVPYFLCDSVINTCTQAGISLRYYSITKDFLPDEQFELESDEYLYLVNYYGQLSDDKILLLKDRYVRVIADYTHSFFQKPIPDIPTLYSCRKYFGLPDGAYVNLPGQNSQEPELQDCSSDRMNHILGRYEHSASEHYHEMLHTAHSFRNAPILRMSPLTRNLLKGISYESAKTKRAQNYTVLHKELGYLNPLNLCIPDGSFSYPFLYKNGPELKKALTKHRIFVPTYWSNVIEEMPETSIEYHYARNILPLPCDQRYDSRDMLYMVNIINDEIKKLENSI